jgi:hypothetical protein
VSLEYLRGLHEKHEQWLLPAKSSSSALLSVSPVLQAPMSPRIRDRVFYLEGDHVHTCIQKASLANCVLGFTYPPFSPKNARQPAIVILGLFGVRGCHSSGQL